MDKGLVVWFTGLPNSGKSTISKLVKQQLELMDHQVEILDSDEVPRSLTKDLSPDWKTRQIQKCNNLLFVANILYQHRVIVLIASVGRLRKMRDKAREEIDDFVEVYLKCPLAVRLERDTHHKYQRHPSTIHYYEQPIKPEVTVETNQCTPDQAAQKVVKYLMCRGYVG